MRSGGGENVLLLSLITGLHRYLSFVLFNYLLNVGKRLIRYLVTAY